MLITVLSQRLRVFFSFLSRTCYISGFRSLSFLLLWQLIVMFHIFVFKTLSFTPLIYIQILWQLFFGRASWDSVQAPGAGLSLYPVASFFSLFLVCEDKRQKHTMIFYNSFLLLKWFPSSCPSSFTDAFLPKCSKLLRRRTTQFLCSLQPQGLSTC